MKKEIIFGSELGLKKSVSCFPLSCFFFINQIRSNLIWMLEKASRWEIGLLLNLKMKFPSPCKLKSMLTSPYRKELANSSSVKTREIIQTPHKLQKANYSFNLFRLFLNWSDIKTFSHFFSYLKDFCNS